MEGKLGKLFDRFTSPVSNFIDKWEKRTMWIAAIAGIVAVLFLVSIEL
ncbi:putative copper-transporting ATPase [Yaravirus sp. 'brasiliensis']|uniref:Copper-transporting ATPase n=1 Tax=Yaravirus sp. 'brasiliensis' TaxID=2739681 RepID=A0AAE7B7S4_9VIRU|nr:putative copper-transporting ATPase [Yaravirus brasiliensis]QKE44431.1 putative copper-transporting ATPase [Yaravirus brasiliensis]